MSVTLKYYPNGYLNQYTGSILDARSTSHNYKQKFFVGQTDIAKYWRYYSSYAPTNTVPAFFIRNAFGTPPKETETNMYPIVTNCLYNKKQNNWNLTFYDSRGEAYTVQGNAFASGPISIGTWKFPAVDIFSEYSFLDPDSGDDLCLAAMRPGTVIRYNETTGISASQPTTYGRGVFAAEGEHQTFDSNVTEHYTNTYPKYTDLFIRATPGSGSSAELVILDKYFNTLKRFTASDYIDGHVPEAIAIELQGAGGAGACGGWDNGSAGYQTRNYGGASGGCGGYGVFILRLYDGCFYGISIGRGGSNTHSTGFTRFPSIDENWGGNGGDTEIYRSLGQSSDDDPQDVWDEYYWDRIAYASGGRGGRGCGKNYSNDSEDDMYWGNYLADSGYSNTYGNYQAYIRRVNYNYANWGLIPTQSNWATSVEHINGSDESNLTLPAGTNAFSVTRTGHTGGKGTSSNTYTGSGGGASMLANGQDSPSAVGMIHRYVASVGCGGAGGFGGQNHMSSIGGSGGPGAVIIHCGGVTPN